MFATLLIFAGTSAPADPREIQVEMTEFAFRPSVLRLTAGRPVRVVLTNRGKIAHQLEAAYLQWWPATVVGGGLHVEAPGVELVRLQPGATATITFLPGKRGRFPFACTIEGHREAGMVGSLEVR